MVHWLALFPLCTALAMGRYERSGILRLLSSYCTVPYCHGKLNRLRAMHHVP
jgi:hypothetical protein